MSEIYIGCPVRWKKRPPHDVGRVERITRDGRNALVVTRSCGVKVSTWVSLRLLELAPDDDVAGR